MPGIFNIDYCRSNKERSELSFTGASILSSGDGPGGEIPESALFPERKFDNIPSISLFPGFKEEIFSNSEIASDFLLVLSKINPRKYLAFE